MIILYHLLQLDFYKEIQRLENIACEITYEGETVSNKIVYDENMYKYPAYITCDGYDYNYEYALIDKDNSRIVYIHLSYPEYSKLQVFKEYLKVEPKNYNLENGTVLENFTIYAHKFDGFDGWIEYSDMK